MEDVELRVNPGEAVGILGPNGAGKTTLLRAISKALKPKLGVVLLDGRDIYSMSEKELAREMAVVPQTPSAIPNFTVLEIVLMGRNPFLRRLELEDKRDLAIAREAMELTGTWTLAERSFTELSGGERQKVTIARALAQEPRVLLLDEPTLHLDVSSQIDIMDLVRKLCDQKRLAVLSVFHDFNLAARYCDKIILMNSGRVLSAGRPQDTLTTENLSKTFGVQVSVRRHPVTGLLYAVPLSTSKPSITQVKGDIHVICGGGTGAEVMRRLVESGWRVSTGVLNILDSDFESAEALKVQVISEAPFSSISEEASNENRKSIAKTGVVVVTDFPVGYGNLKNLEAADYALEIGKPTILIKGSMIGERDFTKGEGTAYHERLLAQGATVAENVDEALTLVERYAKQPGTKRIV